MRGEVEGGGRLRCFPGRPAAGLGERRGPAAVGAAGRAGTEPGRPHGPGGPARPAPAAKLKGGRGLSSLLPIAPPRAPGGAQAEAGPASPPRRGSPAGIGSVRDPCQPHSLKIRTHGSGLVKNCFHWASSASWAFSPGSSSRERNPRTGALSASSAVPPQPRRSPAAQ